MPEGPEVKRFQQKLNHFLLGKTLLSVEVLSGRYTHQSIDGTELLSKPLKIERVECKGKFLYFKFEDDIVMFNTLGMSGSWKRKESKNSRIRLNFEKGEEIYFEDPRNFGTIAFKTVKDLQNKLANLGPDILSDFDPEIVKSSAKQYGKTIVEFLMDQSQLSGVGNYIKSEALYRAKMSPFLITKNIQIELLDKLFKEVVAVAEESFNSGGNTVATYSDLDGETGNYKSLLQVYGKKKDPLGNLVVKIETSDGRTTHYVPSIQNG